MKFRVLFRENAYQITASWGGDYWTREEAKIVRERYLDQGIHAWITCVAA